MKRYTAVEIENFLLVMDKFLSKKTEIVIIGGTAAALAYKITKATQDIDTWNSTQGLRNAYEKAKEETGLSIPLGKASVGDAPYDFEDRLEVYKSKSFKYLVVKIPEVVDLILMKTLRGYEHDLEAIEEMIKNRNVKADILIDRYVKELGAAIGDKKRLDFNFLAVIERCFGKKMAKKAQKQLGL